jgi:hypothetical protein
MVLKKISRVDLVQRSQNESVNLLIQSQDPEIYLAEADVSGARYTVITDNGQRLMTRSLGAMKRALVGIQYGTATLRHQSSFDEMIGNPVAGSDLALEMPLKL